MKPEGKSQYRKIEAAHSNLSNYSWLKQELNSKKNYGKYTHLRISTNILLNAEWIVREIKKGVKMFLEFKDNEKHNALKLMEHKECCR